MTKLDSIKIERNGLVAFGHSWTCEESKANVVIMSGMEEHAMRYDEFARFLNDNGFNVYAIDNFGQGANVLPDQSNLGVVPYSAFRKQVQMVDALVEKLRISARPTFIFAHSMGAILAQDYIQRYTHHVSKVVLCGAMGHNYLVPLGYQLAKLITTSKNRNKKSRVLSALLFGSFNRKIKNKRTKYDWICTRDEVVDKYIEDPLCGYGENNGFCLELLKGMNRLYKKKFLLKIRKDLDIFIIAGKNDPVAGYGKYVKSLEKMYHKLGLTHVGTKIYENSRHELLNDVDKQEVYQDILTFFNASLEEKNVV